MPISHGKEVGHRDYRGGGRSSARETAARVAGGAFAMLFLRSKGIMVTARICEIADLKSPGGNAGFGILKGSHGFR